MCSRVQFRLRHFQDETKSNIHCKYRNYPFAITPSLAVGYIGVYMFSNEMSKSRLCLTKPPAPSPNPARYGIYEPFDQAYITSVSGKRPCLGRVKTNFSRQIFHFTTTILPAISLP